MIHINIYEDANTIVYFWNVYGISALVTYTRVLPRVKQATFCLVCVICFCGKACVWARM